MTSLFLQVLSLGWPSLYLLRQCSFAVSRHNLTQ
jgi:hypothetical protein